MAEALLQSAPTLQEALDFAIEAVDRGDITNGKAALEWVIKQDPGNVNAWLWLACCMPTDSDRQACYRKVSVIQAN